MTTTPIEQKPLPSSEVKVTEGRLNKQVRLYLQNEVTERPRTLVIMLGWLLAKHEVIKKYTNIYLNEGCDVVQIQVQRKHLLTPRTANAMIREVLEICHHSDHVHKPVFVHAISAGIYVYGALLNQIAPYQDKYETFGKRIRGQIYDSLVDVHVFPYSVPTAVTSNKILQRIIRFLISSYMAVARGTTRMYKEAADKVKTNYHKVPTKVVYAQSNTLCNPDDFHDMTKDWVDKGITAEIESWLKAPHAAILKEYPEEYKMAIRDFLALSLRKSSDNNGKMESEDSVSTYL